MPTHILETLNNLHAIPPMIGALVGVSGTAVVSSLLFYFTRKEAKWTATTALYGDFNSKEMSEARNKAVRFLQNHMKTNYRTLDRTIETSKESHEDATAHLKIMRFYQRLVVSQESGRLADKALFGLFASVFAWWWEFSFKEQLIPTNWQAGQQLQRLHDFLASRAKTEKDKADWKEWLQRGIDDRDEILDSRKLTAVPVNDDQRGQLDREGGKSALVAP